MSGSTNSPPSGVSPTASVYGASYRSGASGLSGATTAIRTIGHKDLYRTQTSAVNIELISNSEEALSVLQGTESLVMSEAEKWRSRFLDALAQLSTSTNDMLAQYGVATEMIVKPTLPTLEEMEIQQLALDDAVADKVITAVASQHAPRQQQQSHFLAARGRRTSNQVVHNIQTQLAPNRRSLEDLSLQHELAADSPDNIVVVAVPGHSIDDDLPDQYESSGIAAHVATRDASAVASREDSPTGSEAGFQRNTMNHATNSGDVIDASILESAAVSAEAELQLEQLPNDFSIAATRTYDEFCALLRELRLSSTRAAPGAMTSHARRAEVSTRLQHCAHELLPATLQRFNPVPIVLNLAAALQHDPLQESRTVLSEVQAAVSDIDAKLQQKLRDRSGRAVSEHFVIVEELNEECSKLYRAVMQELMRGYDDVEHAESDVKEFLTQVSSVEGSLSGMDACIAQQQQIEEDAEQDLVLLSHQLDLRAQRHASTVQEHATEAQRLSAELEGLQQRHAAVWTEVLAKLAELGGINEKIATTRESVETCVTRHAAREAHHLRETQALKRFVAARKCASVGARKGSELLQATKTFAADMLQLIYKKEHESVRQRLALEQCIHFYDRYCTYAAHLQEQASKKEARLENSRRLRRSINFQVEVASEAFDPNVHKYREQLLQLSDLVEDIERDVKRLQEELHNGEFQGVWAETIRPVLEAKRIPFDEPAQRAQHLRLDMLQKQFDAVDTFQREEQTKLDEERRVVRVMKNLVSTDQRGSVSTLARAGARVAPNATAGGAGAGGIGGSGTASRRGSTASQPQAAQSFTTGRRRSSTVGNSSGGTSPRNNNNNDDDDEDKDIRRSPSVALQQEADNQSFGIGSSKKRPQTQ